VACKDKTIEDEKSQGGATFNPYNNVFKEDVPVGKAISVTGKKFYYTKMDIRDRNSEKLDHVEDALKDMYGYVSVYFDSEDTVTFNDDSNVIFPLEKTKGVREGNVLTVKRTNTDGYTYDVRIEIHENMVVVIHEGHTYDKPGSYAMIWFEE
jgi:hypothetical protein